MKQPHPPAHYFQMAEEIRAIADDTAYPPTKEMVLRIAEDYERMGNSVGAIHGSEHRLKSRSSAEDEPT
jgi:hypothetical protein